MSKTPPPSLRISGSTPPADDSREPGSALSKLGQSIKNRLGEIQTKPEIIEKMKNFRLVEVQTKPDWMKRSPKQTHEEGPIRWVRIIPFAGEKYVADKLPSKLGGIGGVIHLRFLKDAQGKISLFAGHAKTSKLKNALRQRVPNTDLQDIDAPVQFEERFANRVGELGGAFNEKGSFEAILDALEGETYLDIAFEERPEHEFKQVLRNHAYGGTGKNGSISTLSAINEVFNPFSGASPSNNKSKSSKRELSVEERDQAKRIESLLSEHTNYFRVVIKIGAKHQNHIQTIFNELNTQMKKQHRFSLSAGGKKKLWKNSMGAEALWREEELAILVALPDMTNAQMLRAVIHMKPGERTLGEDELTEGVAIGRLIHPTKSNRLVKIPTDQFLKHGFLSGKTGAGKTSTAIQAIQSLLDDWVEEPHRFPGFSYIDPNGSALTIIMNRLLHMEQQGATISWEKVHYLDMRPESQYPVGLNLLHCNEDDDITEVSQNIVDMIMSTYGSSGTLGKTEKLMDNGLATLLSDRSRVHTVFGINYVYMYPMFRESLTFRHPMLKLFWRTDGADVSSNELTAMNNRLRPLLNATPMRRIFGQTDWSLNIRRWMDDGHIVLINALNLSEVGMRMAMGQLVMQYHATAKQRPQDISKSHVLMIDEAHLAQIPILSKVIAEDRKFGLSLVLITQFPEQFNGLLLDSITENMGTFMTCTLGPKSAGAMSNMMNGAFDKSTLQGLPDNDVAVMTKIDKVPFSFKVCSDPPVIYLPNGHIANFRDKSKGGEMWQAQQWAMDKALELSARDGRSVEEVDREFDEYDEWWQQFAPEDDENDPSLHRGKSDGKAKIYKPTEDEQPILDAIVALAMDQRDWRGRTSALLTQLEDYMSEEELGDWTPNLLGALLARATTWLQSKGIEAESNRIRIGTEWNISAE